MTPRKPSTATPGIVSRTRLKTGTPSITAPSKRNIAIDRVGERVELAKGERGRSLVGGDDVRQTLERRADVGGGRLAAVDVEHRRFDDDELALVGFFGQRIGHLPDHVDAAAA